MTIRPVILAVLCGVASCLCAARVAAQTPATNPSAVAFAHPDSEFAVTGSYIEEFFQCGSILAGACVNQAAAPFQTGVTIPKSGVSTLSPPVNGNNRSINLRVAPASGVLASLPSGVGFVTMLSAIGDPAAGGTGSSARSAASNPFFQSAKTPAAPTGLVAQ